MASGPITSWQIDGETVETVRDFILGGAKITASQGKLKNTGVGSLSLLQQIFPNQESNRDLLHCRRILYQLSCLGRTSTIMLRTSGGCVLVGHRLYILGKPALELW